MRDEVACAQRGKKGGLAALLASTRATVHTWPFAAPPPCTERKKKKGMFHLSHASSRVFLPVGEPPRHTTRYTQ